VVLFLCTQRGWLRDGVIASFSASKKLL
jgi:hypothetical protein